MRKLLFLMLAPVSVSAAPFLVSDPVPASQGAYTVTHCTLSRGATTTNHPVETVAGGVRCKIDLATDSKVGQVSVAFRDGVLNVTGPAVPFDFGPGLPGVGNLRVVPN